MRALSAGVVALALVSACAPDDGRPDRSRADSAAITPSAMTTADTTDARGAAPGSGCGAYPREEWAPASVGAATFVVNRGTRGMTARVRWALAPDSSAMLVVEDPAGLENDPVPDGVLYATERTGRTWRMDSVWSASPSPDWRRVAVGRAVVLGGGEAQVVAPSRWQGAARSLAAIAGPQPALAAESLRAQSYPVSGMGVAEGAAATFVAEVARDEREAPVRFVSLGGWRVRWSCDGHDVLVGMRPDRVQNDAPAKSVRRVAVEGGPPTAAPVADSITWTEGSTLDISVKVERHARTLRARGRRIEGKSDRITVRDSTASGWSQPREIGPGEPLAVTRNGRFVLAIAPRSDARQYESPDHAVVYRVP